MVEYAEAMLQGKRPDHRPPSPSRSVYRASLIHLTRHELQAECQYLSPSSSTLPRPLAQNDAFITQG